VSSSLTTIRLLPHALETAPPPSPARVAAAGAASFVVKTLRTAELDEAPMGLLDARPTLTGSRAVAQAAQAASGSKAARSVKVVRRTEGGMVRRSRTREICARALGPSTT
jgi:hypothetical protein